MSIGWKAAARRAAKLTHMGHEQADELAEEFVSSAEATEIEGGLASAHSSDITVKNMQFSPYVRLRPGMFRTSPAKPSVFAFKLPSASRGRRFCVCPSARACLAGFAGFAGASAGRPTLTSALFCVPFFCRRAASLRGICGSISYNLAPQKRVSCRMVPPQPAVPRHRVHRREPRIQRRCRQRQNRRAAGCPLVRVPVPVRTQDLAFSG